MAEYHKEQQQSKEQITKGMYSAIKCWIRMNLTKHQQRAVKWDSDTLNVRVQSILVTENRNRKDGV